MSNEKAKVFEDEFMEVQSGLIALCMDFLKEKKVDKIYAYCSIEKKSRSFNACYDCGGEIKTVDQMGMDMHKVVQFLRVGSADLLKIRDVCTKHNMPTPTELKLIYEVKTGKFESKYKYEEVCSATTEKTAGEVFDEWIAEMKQEIEHI